MEIRFDGKTALVTGAGKGIGKAVSLKLAEAGANVIAVSRTQSDLDELKEEHPDKIETLCLDVGKWEETREALKAVGPVDLLVNNAAVLEVKQLGQITEDDINRNFDINVKAVINITQLIADEMKTRDTGGAIVNISSVFAMYASSHYAMYCASKGALDQLTRTMAIEYGPYNIRVNSINPTAVRTRMAESVGFFEPGNKRAEMLVNRTPLRRIAETEDIVGPVLFLLSDYASMVSGIAMLVDGGLAVCYN